MSRSATNKQKALDRVNMLWDHYLAHDEKITCADVERLTGRKAANLYTSFRNQRVEGPPVWDSNVEIKKRQIAALRAKADELGRDWLSPAEVAEALDQDVKNVWEINKRLAGKIPTIQSGNRKVRAEAKKDIDLEREEIPTEGVLVAYAVRAGPRGSVIYSLR